MQVQRANNPEQTISILSVCLDSESQTELETAIHAVTGTFFAGNVQQYAGGKNDAMLSRAVNEHHPSICIVDFDHSEEAAIHTVEFLRQISGIETSIFAASSSTAPDSIIRAMRSGCTEYLTKPLQVKRLVDSLTEQMKKRRDSVAHHQQGRVITVLGTKGGAGVTSLAVHLASVITNSQKHTLLIDQHPEIGEVALYLGIGHHQYHFYELLQNLQRLDAELLQGFIVKQRNGLDVLTSPEQFGMLQGASPESIAMTIRFLKREYEQIVIDCAPGYNEWNLSILDASDDIFLIATQDIPSIRNLVRNIDYLSKLSFPEEKVHIVINRYQKKAAISIEQIEKAIQKSVSQVIPDAHSEISEAINRGSALDAESKSDFMQSIRQWSKSLIHEVNEQPEKQEVAARQPRLKYGILGI